MKSNYCQPILLFVLLFASIVSAQWTYRVEISGTVKDQLGHAVPNMKLTLVHDYTIIDGFPPSSENRRAIRATAVTTSLGSYSMTYTTEPDHFYNHFNIILATDGSMNGFQFVPNPSQNVFISGGVAQVNGEALSGIGSPKLFNYDLDFTYDYISQLWVDIPSGFSGCTLLPQAPTPPQVSISGAIKDHLNSPIASKCVLVHKYSHGIYDSYEKVAESSSNSTGQYSISTHVYPYLIASGNNYYYIFFGGGVEPGEGPDKFSYSKETFWLGMGSKAINNGNVVGANHSETINPVYDLTQKAWIPPIDNHFQNYSLPKGNEPNFIRYNTFPSTGSILQEWTLVTNGNFEQGLAGWYSYEGDTASNAYQGQMAASFKGSSWIVSPRILAQVPRTLGVRAISFYHKGEAFHVLIRWKSNLSTTEQMYESVIDESSTWVSSQPIFIPVQANEIAYDVRISFWQQSPSSNPSTVDEVYYLLDQTKVEENKTFADGLGRSIQSATSFGNEDIINSTTYYDASGRPWLTTKPYQFDFAGINGSHNYLFNSIGWAQGFYSATNIGAWPGLAVDAYPYSIIKYFEDPLNRSSAIGGSGTVFQPNDYNDQASSNDHSVRTRFAGKKTLNIDLPVKSKTVSTLNDLQDKTNVVFRVDVQAGNDPYVPGLTVKLYEAQSNTVIYSDVTDEVGEVYFSQGIFYSLFPKYPQIKVGVNNAIDNHIFSLANYVGNRLHIIINDKSNPTQITDAFIGILDPPFQLKYFHTTVADENAKIMQSWKDIFGNIVQTYTTDGTNAIKTVNEYDILGNLLRTTPPKAGIYPSTNKYNTLGQLIEKSDPDAGTVKYMYDLSGNLKFLQDAKMTANGQFLINMYDAHGRIVRKYFCTNDTAYYFQVYADIYNWPYYAQGPSDAQYFKPVIDYIYDELSTTEYPDPTKTKTGTLPSLLTFTNLRGRLAKTKAYNNIDGETWLAQTYYSYDDDGNLKFMVQELPNTKLKITKYDYDNIGRKTKEYFYEDGSDAATYTRTFEYDPAGRLFKIKDALGKRIVEYAYFPTNQVQYASIGQKADGTALFVLEYTYTIRDWVKSIRALDHIGGTELHNSFTELLAYNTQLSTTSSTPGIVAEFLPQYNGTISETVYRNSSFGVKANRYQYDDTYKLLRADFGNVSTMAGDYFVSDFAIATELDQKLTYDVNGNIAGNFRGSQPTSLPVYQYQSGTNRLVRVTGDVKEYGVDVPHRSMTNSNNFVYDSNGNMVEDKSKKMKVEYDWRNLPVKYELYANLLDPSPVSTFRMMYDAAGNRVAKIEE